MPREAWILAALLFAVLAIYAFLPRGTAPLGEDDVKALLLSDLSKEGIKSDEVRFDSLAHESDTVWSGELIISRNQHAPCPLVEKRIYSDVLRFKYRPDPIIEDCRVREPIKIREEALIDSAKLAQVSSVVSAPDVFGCAFFVKEFDASEAIDYCPVLSSDFFDFVRGLPENSWAIQWKGNGRIALVALDENNNVLKIR